MPKKKISKKTSRKVSPSKVAHHTDDHSFMIILGGGFLVIVIIMFFLANQASLTRSLMAKMSTPEVVATEEQVVDINNFAFSPKTITVKAGTAVSWMNSDTVDHSIIADDGTFDTGILAPGEKGSYTFETAGTYTYHCGTHPSMTATVVVE